MAGKLDPKEGVSFEELLTSEVIQSEALNNLLDREGIITNAGVPGENEAGAGVLAETLKRKGEYSLLKKLNQPKVMTHCRILLLCAFSIFLMSCLSWILEKPSFALRRVILSPRSFTEMNLLIGLDVQNTNRFDLTLKSFECAVYIKNEEIGKGRLENEILIPSSSITQVQVPVNVKFKDLGGNLKALFTGGDLPYKIEGKADVSTAFGSLNFTFSTEGSTNLEKMF